jgi:aspartate dehydrogenase
MANMKVGLVGCGNIGADLCIALHKGTIPAEVAALTDIDPARTEQFIKTFSLNATACTLDENAYKVDFLVECAIPEIVPKVIDAAITYRRPVMILSVGALLTEPETLEKARAANIQIRVPAGAVIGLDGIRAAMEAGLHRVVLTTRKPTKVLEGTPYLLERGIEVEKLQEPKLVFEGSALEAVKAFPMNINVAAAVSLVGIGPEETIVRIIADPTIRVNSHEVVAEGAFGRLQTSSENLPSPRNAKSSYLASLSAIAELRAAAEAFAAHN